MKTFTLHLASAARCERIDDVTSFVGADASGSFGLLAGHADFMTVLSAGLARFRRAAGDWTYLACPGALLHFTGGELQLATRRYLCGADYARLSSLLTSQFGMEEAALRAVKDNFARLEQDLYRRLKQLEGERA